MYAYVFRDKAYSFRGISLVFPQARQTIFSSGAMTDCWDGLIAQRVDYSILLSETMQFAQQWGESLLVITTDRRIS